MLQQQVDTTTVVGRHTPLLKGLRTLLSQKGIDNPKILSFGCSTGFECADIHAEIPSATIFGCDIDTKAMTAAKDKCREYAEIFLSTDENMEHHGPFDVVLALNVFCRFPQSAGVENISTIYPFSTFEQGIAGITKAVAPDGYLGLYNGAYFFEDTNASADYAPISVDEWPRNGWIEKSKPNGKCCTNVTFEFQGLKFSLKEWLKWARDPKNREAIFNAPTEVRYVQEVREGSGELGERSLDTVFWQRNLS